MRTGIRDREAMAGTAPVATIEVGPIPAASSLFADSLGWPRVVSWPVSDSFELALTAPTTEEVPQVEAERALSGWCGQPWGLGIGCAVFVSVHFCVW